MYENLIQQVEAQIASWEKLLDSQNEKLEITRNILQEIQQGLLTASTQPATISNNERTLYLDDIKRCNDDIAAIFSAGQEMKRKQDSLKIQLEKLKKSNF